MKIHAVFYRVKIRREQGHGLKIIQRIIRIRNTDVWRIPKCDSVNPYTNDNIVKYSQNDRTPWSAYAPERIWSSGKTTFRSSRVLWCIILCTDDIITRCYRGVVLCGGASGSLLTTTHREVLSGPVAYRKSEFVSTTTDRLCVSNDRRVGFCVVLSCTGRRKKNWKWCNIMFEQCTSVWCMWMQVGARTTIRVICPPPR